MSNPDETFDRPITYDSIKSTLAPDRSPGIYDIRHAIDNKLCLAISEGKITEMDGLRFACNGDLSGRIQERTLWLLQKHSEAELRFARELCRFRLAAVIREDWDITETLGGEMPNTQVFWTFAPYVHSELCAKGVSPNQAVYHLLSWARNDSNRRPFPSFDIHLDGLQFFTPSNGFEPFHLDDDPAHPSHSYARQEASRIADLLLSRNKPLQEPSPKRLTQPVSVADHVNAVLSDAEAIGMYSEDDILRMLRYDLAQNKQYDWHLPAILYRHFRVHYGFAANVLVLMGDGSGDDGPERSAAVLRKMLGWHERHRSAVEEGFQPLSAEALDDATNWLKTKLHRRIDARYPLMGLAIDSGERWYSGDAKATNITRRNSDWNGPLIQLWNSQVGFIEPTGWLFKIH